MSELMAHREAEPFPYCTVKLQVLAQDRARLHDRIERRFHAMLEKGLLAEVETLYRRGDLNPALPSMRAVGYRQLWRCLTGETGLETAVSQAITATRQLAKRQLTWLRAEAADVRFDCAEAEIKDKVLKYIAAATYH
jgi:tRNA dimethylallyltransferase